MKRASGFACLIALLGLLAHVPASAQNGAPPEPANLAELIAAANKEGTLTLAVGNTFGGPKAAQAMQDHLNRKYHTNLQIRYAPISAGIMFVQTLVQEVRANQPTSSDIMFSIVDIDNVPYVQRIDWRRYVPGMPASNMIYDMHAVKVEGAPSGFSYNTKLIPPERAPKTFADLLQPQWTGKIASSPYQGLFLNYIGLPSVFGHQGMLDFTNRFAAQLAGIMVCGEIDRVVSGEFAIFGIDCNDHEVRLRQRLGQPIAEMYPKEGTQMGYISTAIPTTAVHPYAARLFIVYLLSREGQDDLWQYAGEDDDLLPGSRMAGVLADLRKHGVKIIQGLQGTGRDRDFPQLEGYAKEINAIINRGR